MSRLLRTYQRIAQKEHWCDNCCRHIEPGEMYEGTVMVYDGQGLAVIKSHINPRCEPPEDPEDEREREQHLEQTVKEETKSAA